MAVIPTPTKGSAEEQWYFWGAKAEHELSVEGMTKDALELYGCVQTLAQQSASVERIVHFVALVFTTDWSLRRRIQLAWSIVRGH